MPTKVLFICIHNSARSQMAEAWLNYTCGDSFQAQSAGLEPGTLNLLVVDAMAEVGVDISHKGTQRVFDVWKSAQLFAYVITVCDESSAQKCPIFPGASKRLHWSFPDPAALTGNRGEKLERCAKSAMRFARKSRSGVRKSVRRRPDAGRDLCRRLHGAGKSITPSSVFSSGLYKLSELRRVCFCLSGRKSRALRAGMYNARVAGPRQGKKPAGLSGGPYPVLTNDYLIGQSRPDHDLLTCWSNRKVEELFRRASRFAVCCNRRSA